MHDPVTDTIFFFENHVDFRNRHPGPSLPFGQRVLIRSSVTTMYLHCEFSVALDVLTYSVLAGYST